MATIAVPRQEGREADSYRASSIRQPSIAEAVSLVIVVGILASGVYVLGFYLR